jgi:hypothetical protein
MPQARRSQAAQGCDASSRDLAHIVTGGAVRRDGLSVQPLRVVLVCAAWAIEAPRMIRPGARPALKRGGLLGHRGIG